VTGAVGAAAQGLVRLPAWRARTVLAALIAAFMLLVARAVYLQAVKTDFLQEKGDARYSRVLEVRPLAAASLIAMARRSPSPRR